MSKERETLKENGVFKAHVKHEVGGSGGITCYWPTIKSAIEWAATWPDAVEIHITYEIKDCA